MKRTTETKINESRNRMRTFKIVSVIFLFFLFLLAFSIQNVTASWSGGSITAKVSSSTTTFSANSIDVISTGSATTITARYNNIYAGVLWHLGALQQNYPPIISLLSPDNNLMTRNSTIDVSYSVIDQNDDPLNCTLYHSANSNPAYYTSTSTTSWSTITNSITSQDNTYYWYVTCNDGKNITQSAMRNYTIDTTPPAITLYYPMQNNIDKNETTSFQYVVNETNEVTNCTLFTNETNSWQPIQSELLPLKGTLINFQEMLADSHYIWGIECIDNLGNIGWSENRTFEENRLFPDSVSGLANVSNKNSSITWMWTNPTNQDFVGTILYVDGINSLNLSPANSTYKLSNLQGNTTHILTINTYDTAGNINSTNVTSTSTTMPGFLNVSSIITIDMPLPNITLSTRNVTVHYNVSNPEDVSSCTFYLDSNNIASDTNISTSTTNNKVLYNITDGSHNLTISCTSFYGKVGWSNPLSISMLDLSGFNQDTTNITNANMTQVINFTLEVENNAKITFPGVMDLSNTTNISANVKIEDKKITVNSEALPILNRTAILEVYNVPYNNILIWRDGQICQTCEVISKNANTLTFNVTGFSTYIVTSTSSLNIDDDTRNGIVYANESVTFYANYSNITSGLPLIGSCDISINDGGWSVPTTMMYNSTIKKFTYDHTFTTLNSFPYNISCTTTDSGFDNLTATSDAETSPLPTGTQQFVPTTITQINTTRFGPTTPTTSINTAGSNVSEININSVISTTAWQGYYGNITSSTLLADKNQNVMFKWNASLSTGQVFASRNNSISWETVNCATNDTIVNEDVYLGKTGSEIDSVNKTFYARNHLHFVVGARLLQHCASTTLGSNETSGNFWNILIGDNEGTGNAIYTGLINSDTSGFKNEPVDFELLVPVNGKIEGNVVPYYFYLELN